MNSHTRDADDIAIDEPLLAELFSVHQLEQHARKLATEHDLAPVQSRVERLLPRLDANQIALSLAYAMLTDAVGLGRRITPAAEWFIDNYHIVEEQIRAARLHLSPGFSRELPKLASGLPRVYTLALELISHAHGRVDIDILTPYVAAYAASRPLTLGELWAIPIMLRLALLENLRRIVANVTAGRRERECAAVWVERMVAVASREPAKVVLVLAEFIAANPPLTNPFVTELASRLQGQGPALSFPSLWLEHRLTERGQTIEHVFQLVSQSQAADQVAIGNTMGSLRFLGATDWRDFVEAMSSVEKTLRGEAAGVYPRMDFATRDSYRHVVEALARRVSRSEDEIAAAAVRLAAGATDARSSHVGYFLVGDGREILEREVHVAPSLRSFARRSAARHALTLYVGAVGLLTAAVAGLLLRTAPLEGLSSLGRTAWLVSFALSGSQLAVAIVQWGVTLLLSPSTLPRLDLSSGLLPEHHTLVAVPTLLSDIAEIDRLLGALEVRYLANRDLHLSLALVTDLRDAAEASVAGDESLVQHVREGIAALNQRYAMPERAPPFFLFHRARHHNPREGVWMGWERKRGKIEQLNAALRGDPSGFEIILGDLSFLRSVKYVIVLDSDTGLPRDAARQLVGTLAHPLNRPRFDAKLGRVTEGYAILQPRVAITMDSAHSSRFASLFSPSPGIDPYTRAVSDVYQDLFGEGSFIGKGIYDVDAFIEATAGRLPEDRILSHDLLEGAYARAGLVSDVLLFEDYPSAYLVDASRRSRWTRGDWQIAAWLGPWVPGGQGRTVRNPISALSRWKIFDNLRRSLVPAALVSLLLGGLFASSAEAVWFFASVVLTILFLPSWLGAAAAVVLRPSERPCLEHGREIAQTLWQGMLREIFVLAMLPCDAFASLSAVTLTARRLLLTGRGLLEWRTAADAQRSAHTTLRGAYVSMWASPLAAAAVGLWLLLHDVGAGALASPLLVLWGAAPLLSVWSALPRAPERSPLRADDVAFLRGVARRTWRFFETFVSQTDNDLPPDNVQEDPPQGVAHRTSPTNIGLSLLANLAAYDFGYLSAGDVIERTEATLHTMERMRRFRGHLYNWYDTRTLEPLRPMYVSTVDSGNLAGHLLTLAAGLDELPQQPIFRPEIFAGIRDTLDLALENLPGVAVSVRERLRDPPSTLLLAYDLLEVLLDSRSEIVSPALDRGGDGVWWAHAFDAQCQRAQDELCRMAPWVAIAAAQQGSLAQLPSLDGAPTLSEIATLAGRIGPEIQWAALREAVELASERALLRLTALRSLASRCRAASEMEYEFLYDRPRRLLNIGYNADEHRLDAGFYDNLASEARLASFVAIAQGKLPQEHWFSLGRLLTSSAGKPALLSWSGSMFEYLMPSLVMPSYPGTLLDETNRSIVQRQIAYGRERGVPWGISESGYYKTDTSLNYQYRAFGVPGLGFKRGLADDLVVAPYSSALALLVDPSAATANLRRLAREGQIGAYGFYEAVDYTPARVPHGKESATVRSYMSHHQGMTLLSLAGALLGQPMQRRFLSDASLRATELLLHERVPRVEALHPHPASVSATGEGRTETVQNVRVFTTPDTPAPAVQLLSNGSYHVAVTNAGAGYSRWRGFAVTRWREDPTQDGWGMFCYLRDVRSKAFWSAAHQPTAARASKYEAIFSLGRAEFRRRDHEIETHLEISVSPEDDIELRRVCLTNTGRAPRAIELTSYAEVVLTVPGADTAHPAFSNLFVQTEILREQGAILCTRRPRSGAERPPFLIHLVTVQGTTVGRTSYETSRAAFIGRARTARDPAAMYQHSLGDSEGSVLDPVVSIRNTVEIGPSERVWLHIVTGVAETREGALALIGKYGERHSADRLFELSFTHNQVLSRRLGATEAAIQIYERLASHVLYANPALRAPRGVITRNRSSQSALWAYSISGDNPIALVRIADREHLGLVRQMIQAHSWWRIKGVVCDLLIWNEDPSGYRQVLQEEIMAAISAESEAGSLDKPGGIFVRRIEQLSEEDKILMQTVARLIVSGSEGALSEQVERKLPVDLPVPLFAGGSRRIELAPTRIDEERSSAPLSRPDLCAFNGIGGFTRDGREYVIVTSADRRTPAPWVNVIANPFFGTVVSESGCAYTWCENARSYRLTPWHNDPVSDASGEALYLRDEHDGRFWSPTPLPAGGARSYTTRHGFGYSVFLCDDSGITSELQVFVAADAPLKCLLLTLKNTSGRPRRLSLTALFALVLGEDRPVNSPHIVTEVDAVSGALLARNAYSSEFAQRTALLDCSEEQRTVTGDRQEFIGRNGNLSSPACMSRVRLSGRVGAALDPCLAMATSFDLADGQERRIAFTFGSGRDLADARTLVRRFRGVAAVRTALERVWATWNRTLGAVHVITPDASLDFLANGWLLYQVLSCRMWGRSGFYQSGGAFGFRDQLQDAMALVHTEPGLLREQILRSAGRQFIEGDVQHWWHPPQGRGVRTHITDDLLFLPYAVCRYIETIGDRTLLAERVGLLQGRAVEPGEDSYYDLPRISEESATIYEHCALAIRHSLRFGEHGLPLMGSGDWNDGMNLVGALGKGESVWLAFFLYDVLVRFAAVAKQQRDDPFALLCESTAAKLRLDIEAHSWDGAWYRRAWFDDQALLGSSSSPECQIDSLPQSWAVLSGAADAKRSRQALASLDERLVRQDLGLIQLFDPPFDTSSLDPGYIKGYLPGVRENGGQYTHAAVWAAMAFARAGDVQRAWELFGLLDPVHHGDTAEKIARYQIEPYVLAADIYTNPQHEGRGGWSWYTGSAAWMYRLVVESLLGLRLEVDRLRIAPLMPDAWPSFEVIYRHRDTLHHIHVRRVGEGQAVMRVICDGVERPDHSVLLGIDGAEHRVEVEIGSL